MKASTAALVAALTLFASSSPELANAQTRFSQNELRSLPRLCLANTQIHLALHSPMVPEAERNQWAAQLGDSYAHYHHYCWGLLFTRRATSSPSKRQNNYNAALENFQYVITRARPDFVLLPEILLKKGDVLRLVGRDAESATEYVLATQLKPSYSPAYAALIDLYIDLDDVESAKDALAIGLRHAPNSKILALKKAELDGHSPATR